MSDERSARWRADAAEHGEHAGLQRASGAGGSQGGQTNIPQQRQAVRQADARRSVPGRMTWPPELSFALVLDRARAAETQAIGLLYRRFLPTVYRYTLARVSDVHVAEDITADTFFAVVEQIGELRAEDELGFAAWLLGIARNKVAQHHRQRHAHPPTASLDADAQHLTTDAEDGDPLGVMTAREEWSEVVAALDLLTEEQRAVVLYRCVLGYTTEDVATLLQKRPGTIRALQFRALASLERHLAQLITAPQPAQRPAGQASGERRRYGHRTE